MIFHVDTMFSDEPGHSMITATDVYSLTDFQRNARDHIERLQKTGRAEILTVNGRAEVVLQSAEAYQELLDVVDRAESVLGVHRGLLDLEDDQGGELEEVLEELRSELVTDPGGHQRRRDAGEEDLTDLP